MESNVMTQRGLLIAVIFMGLNFLDQAHAQTLVGPGKARVLTSDALLPKYLKVRLVTSALLAGESKLLDERKLNSMSQEFRLDSSEDLKRMKVELEALLGVQDSEFKANKETKIGIEQALLLIDSLLSRQGPIDQQMESIAVLHNLIWAINSNYLYPIPREEWAYKAIFAQTIRGAFYSLEALDVSGDKNGLVDPQNSALWQNPGDISKINFENSAGYDSKLSLQNATCQYARAHRGFGIHPAFFVKCFDSAGNEVYKKGRLKVKFGNETYSGPFNSRIYHAFGFNGVQQDYFSDLKVKYDRRIFKESNSSKALQTEISLIGGGSFDIKISGGDNPFEHVKQVVLNTGESFDGSLLAARLLKNSKNLERNVKKYEYSQLREDSNYNEELESQIDYLIMKEGSFTIKDPTPAIEVGAWDYNDPANFMRRDFRGLAFLSAFLNNYDIRWNNTKLELVPTADGSYEVRMGLSDVGSGLGCAENFLCPFSNNDANSFPKRWLYGKQSAFSDDFRDNDPAVEANGFKFMNFMPNLPNRTYENITRADAKWMARKIAQVTPQQWRTALLASGYSDSEASRFVKILEARKENMLKALRLDR